jgi:hypothetical protein
MQTDGYHLNLAQFSLERFQQILETSELLPSRRILLQNIGERFAVLNMMGLHHLQDLVGALGTKKGIGQFSQQSGLPQEYLEILIRQTKIYTPQPVALKDFPGVDARHIALLADLGIRNTRQLFAQAATDIDQAALSALSSVPQAALVELVQLSDLVRAGWVGPIFARLFIEAGVKSIQVLAEQAPQALFERLCLINKSDNLTKASFTVKDVAACIEIARMLPIAKEL